LEYTIQILALMEPVLLRLLWFIVSGLGHDGHEGELQRRCQSSGKVRNQIRVILGRNAGKPFGRRVRLPAIPQHLCYSLDQFVPKMPPSLIVRHKLSPAGIAPPRENATGFGAKLLGQISSEAIFSSGY